MPIRELVPIWFSGIRGAFSRKNSPLKRSLPLWLRLMYLFVCGIFWKKTHDFGFWKGIRAE